MGFTVVGSWESPVGRVTDAYVTTHGCLQVGGVLPEIKKKRLKEYESLWKDVAEEKREPFVHTQAGTRAHIYLKPPKDGEAMTPIHAFTVVIDLYKEDLNRDNLLRRLYLKLRQQFSSNELRDDEEELTRKREREAERLAAEQKTAMLAQLQARVMELETQLEEYEE